MEKERRQTSHAFRASHHTGEFYAKHCKLAREAYPSSAVADDAWLVHVGIAVLSKYRREIDGTYRPGFAIKYATAKWLRDYYEEHVKEFAS